MLVGEERPLVAIEAVRLVGKEQQAAAGGRRQGRRIAAAPVERRVRGGLQGLHEGGQRLGKPRRVGVSPVGLAERVAVFGDRPQAAENLRQLRSHLAVVLDREEDLFREPRHPAVAEEQSPPAQVQDGRRVAQQGLSAAAARPRQAVGPGLLRDVTGRAAHFPIGGEPRVEEEALSELDFGWRPGPVLVQPQDGRAVDASVGLPHFGVCRRIRVVRGARDGGEQEGEQGLHGRLRL